MRVRSCGARLDASTSSSRVFRAMDRSLSRRPRGGCEARVRRGTSVWDGGFTSRVRATTTAAGWPRDFSGAFGREARAFVWLLAGADGSLAVCPCGLCLAVRGGRRAARMGRLGSWRICGVAAAVVGRRRWCVGPGRCPVEGQSGGRARYLLVYRVAAVPLLLLALAGRVTSLQRPPRRSEKCR